MGRILLSKVGNSSVSRKMGMGTWKAAGDPSIYGLIEIDMTKTLEMLPDYCSKHGVTVTPTHLTGTAVAYCLKRRPEINSIIRGKRLYLRKDVSLFYTVNIPGKNDKVGEALLGGINIENADKLGPAGIAKVLKQEAMKLRSGESKWISVNFAIVKHLPWFLVRYYLNLISFLLYGANLSLGIFGVPRDPFGSAMVSSLGSMGIDLAWVPICNYTRIPLYFAVGAVRDRAWVVDGKVEARPIMPIAITLDHRFVDGVHGAQIARDIKRVFEHPEKYLFNS